MALCVQQKGHILSENLQYAPLDSLRLGIGVVGEAVATRFIQCSEYFQFCVKVFIKVKLCLLNVLVIGLQFAPVSIETSFLILYHDDWQFRK